MSVIIDIMAIMVWCGMGIYLIICNKENKKQLKEKRKTEGELVFVYYILNLLLLAPVLITMGILEKINGD